MNILNRTQHQRGVGLIEVLVALVVIAIGVIAVLGLQGTLMSGSSTTKARNEALALAREKTEELRNAVELGQFDTDLAVQELTDDPDGKINGVNAQFTRSWSIVDVDSVKDTREVVMQVAWTDANGEDNSVTLNTLVAYASPMVSALTATASGNLAPGGGDTGYEGLHRETPMDEEVSDDRNPETDPDKALDEHFGVIDVMNYSNGHVQVRVWDEFCAAPDRVLDSEGQPIKNGAEYLCVSFTAFGGTLLRFGGTLYVHEFLKNNELLVKATSPAYCAYQEVSCGSVDTGIDCMEYLCYVSGDCAKNTDGANGCPATDTTALDEVIRRGLSGGWYGKIGYYSPTAGNSFPTICMSKEVEYDDGVRELEDIEVSARAYYSERTDANGKKWREGINQSYSGHNTNIVRSKANSADICDTGYDKLVSAGIVWNSFVKDEVVRSLDADDLNTVLGRDETYSDIVANYGSIDYPDHPPIGDDEELVGHQQSGEFESLETSSTGAYAASVDGECVIQEGQGNKAPIYACNYVNTDWTSGWSWSGEITARGTMSYEVADLETGVITSYVDAACTVTNFYNAQSPGRYPAESLPKTNPDSTISCSE